MSTSVPAIHVWNLKNYARQRHPDSAEKNEYFWSCLDAVRTPLKMTITPALQLMILSSDQCIEEFIDIWLMFNCTRILVHCKSVLFLYTWPPSSSPSEMTRSFRVQFTTDKDLSECLKVLQDYFPIIVYAPNDVSIQIESSEPTTLHPMFLDATRHALALEQTTTMTVRTEFVRQYLSTCIMDPAFSTFVNTTERILKRMLMDK